MRGRRQLSLLLCVLVVACARDERTVVRRTPTWPKLQAGSLPKVTGAHEPNGENNGPAPAIGSNLKALASTNRATFVATEPPPATAHPMVCDMVGFAGALYVSHAVRPIDVTGARVHRYDRNTTPPWSLIFDWDREADGPRRFHDGGGEGLTRLRVIGERLVVADADTPGPGGYGLSPARYENYLFVSNPDGTFPPLAPGLLPPAGTKVMPLAFHAFDAIAYRGALVASGGSGDTPRGPYPAGLWVGSPADTLLARRYMLGRGHGVVRTTYMHRFAGRLYIGFQNNERRARWDLAILTGDPRHADTPAPILARVTNDGGWLTRRFASSADTLYWLASGYRGDGRGSKLFVSHDGERFSQVPTPSDAGALHDIVLLNNVRYLLAEHGLYRGVGQKSFVRIAAVPADNPFNHFDTFCSAPLVVFNDNLFAGSTNNGLIYRITP